MPTETEFQKILNRIAALRQLSLNNPNAKEALAAAQKADLLIQKYRISEQQISDADPSKAETPTLDDEFLYETGRQIAWKTKLAVMLSENYGCAIYNDVTRVNKRQFSRLRTVGKKSDREIVHYLFDWLSGEIERVTVSRMKGAGAILCATFSDGMVNGIKDQFEANKAAQKAAAEGTEIFALERINNRLEESKNLLNKLHPDLRNARGFSRSMYGDPDDQNEAKIISGPGRKAGREVAIHDAITGSGGKNKLIGG